jgi:hypothetical protein
LSFSTLGNTADGGLTAALKNRPERSQRSLLSNGMEGSIADDKTLRAPQDVSRISLSEDYMVRYWTHKFGVSAEAGRGRPPCLAWSGVVEEWLRAYQGRQR